VLADAQRAGFLGGGPATEHVAHSRAMAIALGGAPSEMVADLGTGGGVPGLVLALLWPDAVIVLIESNRRRARFLHEATARLGVADRVTVLPIRAEDAGRLSRYRGRCDVVTARAFGAPAVTAECGAPLLRVGGLLLVAEPPESRVERWPTGDLGQLGLVPAGRAEGRASFQLLRQERECPDRYPRRVGVPAKRPLWLVPRETC